MFPRTISWRLILVVICCTLFIMFTFLNRSTSKTSPGDFRIIPSAANIFRVKNSNNYKRTPLIPHILHQAWDSSDVPQELATWIKSWKIQNPDWEYWLWTPDDVRALLKDRYPEYIDLYNGYRFNIFRSDAMRYFLMDSFGGFYADLDMECFKPLDIWTYDHQCLLSHETYEHPALLFGKTSPNVMTTIFACRPGHPFFKQVIEDLPGSFREYPMDVLNGTGPFFLDRNFRRYNQSGNAFMTSSELLSQPRDPNSISVVPPEIFLPTYDPANKDGLRKKCSRINGRNKFAQETCARLDKRNFTNEIGDKAYSNHYWVHIFLDEKTWANKKVVSVHSLVPDVITYRTHKNSQVQEQLSSATVK